MSTTVEAVTGGAEFAGLFEPFRRELLAHCYRMLGSVHDAEDLVQETYLRAWRSHGRFEGRSSLRVWLYKIATNVCLRAIEQGVRRAVPSGLGAPADDPHGPALAGSPEVAWLQPLPGVLPATSADPADVVAAREGVRLAFVAALQHLPARQRAVLVLRDVLAMPAAEVAGILDTTTAAVNSALQRAHAQLGEVSPTPDDLAEPGDPGLKALLDRYVTAFHDADVAALEQVLRDDVALEMPPVATWFEGLPTVLAFFAARVLVSPGRIRLLPTTANGQPAFGAYIDNGDGVHRAYDIHVLDVRRDGIARISVFIDPELFDSFGLPRLYPQRNPDPARR